MKIAQITRLPTAPIEIATRASMKPKITGKIDRSERDFTVSNSPPLRPKWPSARAGNSNWRPCAI